MAKATVRAKDGTKFEIEGTPQEISKIIADVEKKSGSTKSKNVNKKNASATDFILQLREQGFFRKPKSLVDVKAKLAENGLIYPVTSLSGVVLAQVRKRNLGRIKDEKIWKYVQR